MALNFDDEKRINDHKGLKFWRNARNKFAVFQIHYSADPDKDSDEWIQKNKAKIPADGWQREYEINFETFAGKPVYGDFNDNVHVASVSPRLDLPIIRSWDWGYGHPACVWWQIISDDRILVFDELMGKDEEITTFAPKVLERWKPWANSRVSLHTEDYGDPAGNQNNDKSAYTTIQLLKKLHGIYIKSKASGIMNGVDFIRYLFVRRNEQGGPVILIHPRCEILIHGFRGKYSLGLQETSGGQKELPIKDGYYDHLQDAFRMGIINKFNVNSYGEKEREDKEYDLPQRIIRSKLLGY